MEEEIIQEVSAQEEVVNGVILPSDEVPFTMPEKFAGKSAEDIARSYLELEAMQNRHKEETPKDNDNGEPNKDNATSTEDLITEYAERNTELTEEDYKILEEKGYSRKQVDIYKAGVEAQRNKESLATIEKAGTTAEEATSAINWARENWSEDRIANFNATIETADQKVQIQLLQMLTDAYRNGTPAQVDGPVHSNTAPKARPQGYESMEQMIQDMKDPRYDNRTFKFDPAYYKAVRDKAAKSNF